jgi:hypothetical protein
MARPAEYPDELIARIRAGVLFMDVKIVARLVNVPASYVAHIAHGKRRPHIEADREVVAALEHILRQGVAA